MLMKYVLSDRCVLQQIQKAMPGANAAYLQTWTCNFVRRRKRGRSSRGFANSAQLTAGVPGNHGGPAFYHSASCRCHRIDVDSNSNAPALDES
jgi:hypothetical protein